MWTVNILQIVTVKIFLSITTVSIFIFHERLAVALLVQEAAEEIDSTLKKDFRQLETGILERNCKSVSSLFSLSNIMTKWEHPGEVATDIAACINNSCAHILDKYELTIVRQLDIMLLKWRGKSQKQSQMAQWSLFSGG